MNAAARFVATVRGLAFENVFNPYFDRCPVHDRADAPDTRSATLSAIIGAAASRGIHSVWIGRDLGYRGGRRTGLALTDDVHVAAHAARWGIETQRCTKGLPVKERTAELAWSVLDEIELPVFLWNVFPLHPHEPGLPFTNRSHRASERAVGEEILSELLRLLRPERVVALGGDAASCGERVAPGRCLRVRHPSYGGQADFLRQMSDLYGPRRGSKSQADLFGAGVPP
ncbi:uracil-DNA glycosylase [Bradyrhizobium septentrionale]|uniref:Uracil-DNA glycosylase n=1 Tax=Bradyrhizobium septentrionale TaxID=1404411 RepID=A0A973W687_9BRAD|nr:uracil-DNA glycosylase [Bradyrhizobium septentrionale]UGY16753.1 uracil-DNA glycosylase [Bradyrhizobium septentrionale]